MTLADVALDVLCLLALVLTWWRARGRVEHRPLAVLLAVWLPSVLLRRVLRLFVFEPRRDALVASGLDPAAVPLTGILRTARHLADACLLVWGWGLVGVALAVLLPWKLRPRWALAPYLGSLLVLVLGYPALRYHLLAVALLVIHLGQVLALGAIVVAWLRGRVASVQPSRVQALVLVLGALHLALVLPMALMALPLPQVPAGSTTPNPFASWWLAQGQYAVIYLAVVAFMVWPTKGGGKERGNGKANGGGNGAAAE